MRTVYRFDVRTPEEYEAGHVPGFRSAPGGQLVQETDMFAPVRGARVILADNDGVRANMSASWLAQMNLEVYVVDGLMPVDFAEKGRGAGCALRAYARPPSTKSRRPIWSRCCNRAARSCWISRRSANYVKRHIPGAWFAIRAQLDEALHQLAGCAALCA